MKIKKRCSPKLVFGIGINDADYVVQRKEKIEVNGKRKQVLVWICPYYRVWHNMLKRGHSPKYQETHPTYKGCSVSEDWRTFSNFRAWMVMQDWEGMQLDKDILFEGNRVYSKETCVFVTKAVNMFTTDCRASRGECLLGVSLNKRDGNFQSRCRNPLTKKQENLGYFVCEQEAHNAWLKRKLELAYELADIQTDDRVAKALVERYTNYSNEEV